MDADKSMCRADEYSPLPEGLLTLMPEVRQYIGKMMRQTDRAIKLYSRMESQFAGDECQEDEAEAVRPDRFIN